MSKAIQRVAVSVLRWFGVISGIALLAYDGLVLAQISVPPPVCYRATELNYSFIRNSTNDLYDVYPIRLTDSGAFTGYIYYHDAPRALLFYSPESGFVDLGRWNGLGTRGLSLNERGQIAVRVTGPNLEKMFLYAPGAGFHDLGSLGNEMPGSEHFTKFINASGQITGFSETPNGDAHAFRWTEGTGMEDIGTLPGGWFSTGNGINSRGWVSGSSRIEDGSFNVFLSRPGEPIVDLGPGIGGDINNRGVIIGSGPNGIPELLYDGRRVRIAPNFGIANYSVGCLNDHNLFRGTYWDSRLGIGFTAIVGSEKHGIVDLNKLIPTNSGWVLTEGTGMNNKCQIVGRGWNGNAGRNTIFRLDPVIPPITIRHASTNVLLSWPDTFFPLRLEEADGPEATTWQAVSGVTTNWATLPLAHSKRFYRLAIPPPPPPVL
jgi:probable HAF family extracellular repeat protein